MDDATLQRLDKFLGDPNVPEEDKRRAVAMARTQQQTAPEDSGLSRAGGYVQKRIGDFVGAGQGVVQDIGNVVRGEPYGAGFPGKRGALDTVGDVAQVAAPVLAPGLTAAGVGAGAATRAAGYPQDTAEEVETGANLLGGAAGVIRGAVKGATGAKALLQARYKAISDAAIDNGRVLDPSHYATFAQDLEDAIASPFAKPKEIRAVKPLLEKLRAPAYTSTPVGFKDLDDAKITLQSIRGRSYIRGLVTQAVDKTLEGTPEGAALRSTNKAWQKVTGKPLLRGGAGLLSRGVGIYEGAQQISEGRPKLGIGLIAAGALGGRSRGQLTAGARGLLAPAGRAATSGLQTPGVRGVFAADSAASESAPSDLEDTPDEPTIQRTTPAPAGPTRDRRAAAPSTAGPFGREVDAVSRLTGVPAPFLRGVMRQESGGNPNAVSHPEPGQAQTPAHGLMQITPGTFEIYRDKAEELLGRKADIHNPLDNLLMSGLLYRNYLDKTGGDVEAAARLYFGGGGTGPRTRQYGRDIASQYTRALAGR